jgi:hypothetical protein
MTAKYSQSLAVMPEDAATLHGGADALLSVGSDQWEDHEERIRAQDISVLHDKLGDEFERCYATGRAMPHGEIIKFALARVPLL